MSGHRGRGRWPDGGLGQHRGDRLLVEGALSCVLPLAHARAASARVPGPVDLVVGLHVANEARQLRAC